MRYPIDLQKGGTIGFLAPSFGCATEPYRTGFHNSLEKWEKLGHKTLLGPNCYTAEGIGISNTPPKCGAEVMDMFLSDRADCLISCGGGELMCEILDEIDFEKLKNVAPKWFMGYSDNTNLTYLLTTLCDTASIYGPCAATFGMEPWHESLTDAYRLLRGDKRTIQSYDLWEKTSLKDEEHPLVPYHVTEPNIPRIYCDGKLLAAAEVLQTKLSLSGRLLGGCMDCLVHLIGTKYDRTTDFCEKYKKDGILWFMEACELNVFSIRRTMWQMEQAGWFRYVKGFLFGRAYNGEAMMGLDVYNAVLEVAKKYGVPVLMDMDIGHCAPMMPLVTGSMATVTVQGESISVTMEYLP